MMDYLPQIFLFLIISGVSAQNCSAGWFGKNCSFLCHCFNSADCDVNGQCPNNGLCQIGYFGPACQYVDLVTADAASSVEVYLRDSNDNTCNTNATATSVEISLKTAFPFSWFRIYADKNTINFTTTLNNGTACNIERKFLSSTRSVDVTCDVIISIYKLRIEGSISPHICSIYISGGRNVALRQQASQTSNFFTNLRLCQAMNAVDGNSEEEIYYGHCATTAEQSTPPEWYLQYNNLQILYEVRAYSGVGFQGQLKNFVVMTYSNTTTLVTTVPESSSRVQQVYRVIIESRTPVIKLTIRFNPNITGIHRRLTMCELETYGDSVCPEDTYGLECDKMCNCTVTEVCSSVIGVCTPGCEPGFYGSNCSDPCNQNCLNVICQYRSGKCLQCIPGYAGDMCDKECPSGTFGPECVFNCSENCMSVCNHITGNCSCMGNYTGLYCEECRDGFFGESCENVCVYLCRKCEMDSGDCEVCKGHHDGISCQSCLPSFYGPNCEHNCSVHCVNRTCHPVTGHCKPCVYGYTGAKCDRALYLTESWMFLLLACPVGILICLFILSTRMTTEAAETSHAEGDDQPTTAVTSSKTIGAREGATFEADDQSTTAEASSKTARTRGASTYV